MATKQQKAAGFHKVCYQEAKHKQLFEDIRAQLHRLQTLGINSFPTDFAKTPVFHLSVTFSAHLDLLQNGGPQLHPSSIVVFFSCLVLFLCWLERILRQDRCLH